MMHKKRKHEFHVYEGEEGLEKVVEFLTVYSSMVGCTAFTLKLEKGTIHLLNDSTGGGRLQEYAVLTEDGVQIESLTTSWIEADKLRGMLLDYAERQDEMRGNFFSDKKRDLEALSHPVNEFCHLCR